VAATDQANPPEPHARRRAPLVLGWHDDEITSLAIAPDGKSLASGSRDATIKLWDLEGRRERATLRGHAAPILALAFSPDGESLASADADRTLKVWDVATGREQISLSWREPVPHEAGSGPTAGSDAPLWLDRPAAAEPGPPDPSGA
jgi:WD40 repeat protein